MATSKAKKRRKILIFSVIVLVVGGLTAAALLRRREPVIVIQTEKVARRSLTEVVVANGRIQPVLEVKISPEVSGEIIELPVKEGQAVKRNDLLLKVKPELYVAAKHQAEASYNGSLASRSNAEASLLKAKTDFDRSAALFKNNLISESDYIAAKTTYDIAKAQLEGANYQVDVAKAALDKAAEDLSLTIITSPIDGTVSRLNSRLGERVVGTSMMAGTEVMTIADLNAMEARVDIGEVDVPLIAVGQHARLEVDAFKDRKFNGTVTEIANSSKNAGTAASSSSQEATKFEVKIRVQDKAAFRPGMSVTAEIETRYRTNVLTVPIASVTTRLPKPLALNKPTAPNRAGAATNRAEKAGTDLGTANAADAAVTATNTPTATNNPARPATNTTNLASAKKPGETPKPIEVVFIKDGDRVKMLPVKRGISDDAYVELTDGVKEGQEVVSGGYKAISRELEDGKKVRVGPAKGELPKEQK